LTSGRLLEGTASQPATRAEDAAQPRTHRFPYDWGVCAVLLVAGITFRVLGTGQSLFGDELFTYDIASRHSIFDVLHALRHSAESTPPLHYVLAWGSTHVGDPTISVRLPSLLAGAATIVVVFLLARRIAGMTCAVVATGGVALSPFAISYSIETRAYSLAAFFVACSTLVLVYTVVENRRRMWVLYWLAATCALYTHYTAAFPIFAQFLWALWRSEHRRDVLAAHAGIALTFLPWLPFVQGNKLIGIAFGWPLSFGSAWSAISNDLLGHPGVPLADLPGSAGLAAGAVVLGIALVGAGSLVISRRRRAIGRPRWARTADIDALRPSEMVLVAAVAGAAPVGLLLYLAASGVDLYNPRNLSTSLPALFVLIGALVAARGGWLTRIGAVLSLVAVSIGAVQSLEPRYARPALRTAARFVESQARPGDVVLAAPILPSDDLVLRRDFAVHLHRKVTMFGLVAYRRRGTAFESVADPRAWSLAPRRRLFIVGPLFSLGSFRYEFPRPPARYRLELLKKLRFAGLVDVELEVYEHRPKR